MVFSSILHNAKKVDLMAYHPDFFKKFQLFYESCGKYMFFPLKLQGALEPTLIFPSSFLILSPVNAVFALCYLYTVLRNYARLTAVI